MIGDKVSYLNEYDEKVTGVVTDISSDRSLAVQLYPNFPYPISQF